MAVATRAAAAAAAEKSVGSRISVIFMTVTAR
jgi:hypothetical protein